MSDANSTFPQTVFDIRWFREPRGFVNLGVHVDYKSKNLQLFAGRWHLSLGWHYDEVHPHPGWESVIAYRGESDE